MGNETWVSFYFLLLLLFPGETFGLTLPRSGFAFDFVEVNHLYNSSTTSSECTDQGEGWGEGGIEKLVREIDKLTL